MNTKEFDVIIVGSGMGGLSAGAILASKGLKILVLEKAAIAGGCSSSYKRKDAVFESGATTLIGFDENQPLRRLEEITGIEIPREPLDISMRVHFENSTIDRPKSFSAFLSQSIQLFGYKTQQIEFWKLVEELNSLVWRVSKNNVFFPPKRLNDWIEAIKINRVSDLPNLRFLFKSTYQVVKDMGIESELFIDFIDQQLMITAQSKSADVPFLFAAPALFYPHVQNYYVRGGLWNMVHSCTDFIIAKGGDVWLKQEVDEIAKVGDQFVVNTRRRKRIKSDRVILNIPIWNAATIVKTASSTKLHEQSKRFEKSWGAFTMGIVVNDLFEDNLPLHHQIHYNDPLLGGKGSIFVSLSKKDDSERNPTGCRVANISTHTDPDEWFKTKDDYEKQKYEWQERILFHLRTTFKAFELSNILSVDSATPLTWQKWVGRQKGKVGGLPQSMSRSVLDWPETNPEKGLYLVGDTTYPGQGIPGVTLSGINVSFRILKEKERTGF